LGGVKLFALLKKRTIVPGLTAISLTPAGVCLVRIVQDPDSRPRVTLFETRSWGMAGQDRELLTELVGEFELDKSQCTTLLSESEYNLLLTEAPDVPTDELRAAVRWRIKDLIDYHINDATLDVFAIPADNAPGQSRSMYAVAARNSVIQDCVDQLEGAGINLDIIDIPELGQRNLASLLPDDTQGVVLLHFGRKGGLITITRQGDIFLTRNIDIGLETLQEAEDATLHFDRIALEVQRSLDYYDSHFRQAPVRKIAITPLSRIAPGLLDYLNANLSLDAEELNLPQLLDWEAAMPAELSPECTMTIGAALRQEQRVL